MQRTTSRAAGAQVSNMTDITPQPAPRCSRCAAAIPRRELAQRGRPRRFCTAECRNANSCQDCGIGISPGSVRCRPCSKACRQSPRIKAYCRVCNAPIRTSRDRRLRDSGNRFCSKQCYAEHLRRTLNPNGVIRYRARYDLDAIYIRDKGVCHLCHRKVKREHATADHLVPRVHGGSDNPDNLSLAHRSCNSRRHTGRIPAQLRLGSYEEPDSILIEGMCVGCGSPFASAKGRRRRFCSPACCYAIHAIATRERARQTRPSRHLRVLTFNQLRDGWLERRRRSA